MEEVKGMESESKNNKKERPNSRSSLLKTGCYAAFYTRSGYFVKVKPALTIDKVVFSFVKKGTSGKGFDIYVDADEFDLLCDSILSNDLYKKLQGTSQDEPAWDYTTGKTGNKILKIYQGNNGIVINGFISDLKQYGNVPVNYLDLRVMAKWHKRISNIYFEKMAQVCINAMEENAKYYHDQDEPEELGAISDMETSSEQNAQTEQGTNTESDPENQKFGNRANKTIPKNPTEFLIVKTTTNVQKYGKCGNYCFKGITQKGKELIFVITPDNINHMDSKKWKVFYESTKNDSGIFFKIGYVTCKDKLLVTKIESAAA